jgi:ParB family chromosome partitioning protein
VSKKGLGRGLQALLSDELETNLNIKEISINEIDANPDQPRREFDLQSLNELADSIRQHGLLQPILVRPLADRYCVIAGERRLRAAKIAELTTIPCIVQVCSDIEVAERALIENIQRTDLNPIEEGLAYKKLIDEYGFTQDQVAQHVGKARTTITNLMRVVMLPEPVLDLIRKDKISLGHAKVLLGINESSLQVLIAQKIALENLSVRQTEVLVSKTTDHSKPLRDRNSTISNSSILKGVEERLRSNFQTKVELKGSLKSGKIEIRYFSEEELNRLLELWNICID